jgi:hypothetical protein
MTKNMTRLDAINLVQSPRGQYIMSQALTIAIAALQDVEPPMREISNIDDMTTIRDELFPLYIECHGEFITEYRKLTARLATKQPDVLVDPLGMEDDDE